MTYSALGGYISDMDLSPGLRDVLAECDRQIEVEGFASDHDDEHVNGDLAFAASFYATPPDKRIHWDGEPAPAAWPWDPAWWKPTERRRDLVKATALLIKEIERLDRAAARAPTETP